MLRLRISLLGLVAVFAASMFSAAVASAEGPYWYTSGHVKLVQGSKGVKLLNKGPLTLESTLSSITMKITCGYSTSNGTIDGQGSTKQGQGKGTVTYEQCKVETVPVGKCEVVQPITTSQLKTHLVRATVGGVERNGELLEPSPSQQSTGFVKLTLKECGVLNGPHEVHGSVVGLLEPSEEELTEGTLTFPETPIKKVKHEGQEPSVGLFLGTSESLFTGKYGARLQNGEMFGAFLT